MNTYYYSKTITNSDIAAFQTGIVHAVYSTFAGARDAEYVCRLHVLATKKECDEGIGTFINIRHHAPAHVGEIIHYTSQYINTVRGEIHCKFEGKVNDKLIVSGTTGQRVLSKDKIKQLFNQL